MRATSRLTHRLCRAAAPLLLLATTTAAAPQDMRGALLALQTMDATLGRVGYRLVTANVALCDRRQPASGLLLHAIEQYGGAFRPAAADFFALGAAPGVSAIVPDSPAARAGIVPGDAVEAIGGAALPPEPAAGQDDFARMAVVLDRLDAALAAGPVALTLPRGAVTLAGVPACASRFQVKPSQQFAASADGRYVEVSAALMAYVKDENELAVVVAHELAHNILKHRELLDAQGVGDGLFSRIGSGAAKIRETENAADRFSLRLLANAGYPLAAAPAFWRRFGREHGHGIFSDSTHLRWKKRVALIEAEIARLGAAQ